MPVSRVAGRRRTAASPPPRSSVFHIPQPAAKFGASVLTIVSLADRPHTHTQRDKCHVCPAEIGTFKSLAERAPRAPRAEAPASPKWPRISISGSRETQRFARHQRNVRYMHQKPDLTHTLRTQTTRNVAEILSSRGALRRLVKKCPATKRSWSDVGDSRGQRGRRREINDGAGGHIFCCLDRPDHASERARQHQGAGRRLFYGRLPPSVQEAALARLREDAGPAGKRSRTRYEARGSGAGEGRVYSPEDTRTCTVRFAAMHLRRVLIVLRRMMRAL